MRLAASFQWIGFTFSVSKQMISSAAGMTLLSAKPHKHVNILAPPIPSSQSQWILEKAFS